MEKNTLTISKELKNRIKQICAKEEITMKIWVENKLRKLVGLK